MLDDRDDDKFENLDKKNFTLTRANERRRHNTAALKNAKPKNASIYK